MTYRALLRRFDDLATHQFHISYSAVLFGHVNRIFLGSHMKLMFTHRNYGGSIFGKETSSRKYQPRKGVQRML